MNGLRILVVRLGAMGDIIHTLPAVASLKQSFPRCHLAWAVEARWAPLLQGNVFVDQVITLQRRGLSEYLRIRSLLRAGHFDIAVDFQGLLKSAVVASAAASEKVYGYHRSCAREPLAAMLYSHAVKPAAIHVVDRNLELASAAGATSLSKAFSLPPGEREGDIPDSEFVLASPLAGWKAKQWPLEYYEALGKRLMTELGLPLVLNGPERIETPSTCSHVSSILGLIHVTRRAAAVIGVDSGPLHMAAAIQKPGVAIFGPTDPARNGPYGGTITVLRDRGASTTYKRGDSIDSSMRAISVGQVFDSLAFRVRHPAGA